MSASSASQPPQAPPSPRKVALAIAIFFPYGFYLLWKHPTLGKKPGWWIGGIAYVVFAMFMAGERSLDTKAMRRVADATLPAVYGDYEMKWGKDFLAGKNPSKGGWGGTAELPNGTPVFVSFFPVGSDFVWLSSPSDGGIYASGYSDTLYWNSKGERINDKEAFWKRAGHPLATITEDAKEMAKLNRANDERKRERNIERMRDLYELESAKRKKK